MRLLDLFKKCFENYKIKKNLKTFNKYLKNTKSELTRLKIVSAPTNKILEIYKLIESREKYLEVSNEYMKLLHKIEIHNKKVNEITSVVDSFSFENIISNFDMKMNEFNMFISSANEIKIFSLYDKPYKKFISEVDEIKTNKDSIIEQFKTKKDCINFLNEIFSKNNYIDADIILKIKKMLDNTKFKLNQHKKSYYSVEEYQSYNSLIEKHNEEYVLRNIPNKIFDNVEGKSLSIDQRRAILTDSKSNLVIAGAGSGKTLTICGKAKWLLEDQNISKDDIVFLSYSRASADDLKNKLSGISDNLNVSTFHSLGLRILESHNRVKQNVDSNYDVIIERFFSEEMLQSQNIKTLRKVLDFYGKFAFSLSEEKYETKGEYFKKLKEVDFQTLKQILVNLSNNPEERETILKEKVKSFEEMAIANFYFLNGIRYRYEKPFPVNTATSEYRQYNPDFTLLDYDIYHEHYGVDKNGRATQYSKEEEIKYINTMKWKESIHNKIKTNYIKTYSYEFRDETLFDKLEKELESLGVVLNPISENEVKDALSSVYKNRNFKSFIKLVKTFINLYKSRYSDSTYFEILKTESFANAYERQRTILFLDICKEVYDYYKSELGDQIDFDDMILEAIKIIPTNNNFKYKYIIIDEFQDISYSRMQLLRTLVNHGNSKVFAVGDDWQSIYRFAGSDLGIFINFDNFFESTTQSMLENNYRNPKELHKIIEPFITLNPEQKKKNIKFNKTIDNPVKIIYYDYSKISALNLALTEIEKLNKKANVLLLGRNNFDIEEYLSKSIQKNREGNIKHEMFSEMKITFKTVHRSKGLEEDFVIVINNEDSKTGFPNKIEDDPILKLVLSDKSNFEFSEERRLFYVALTRTKSYCYLLVDSNKQSVFIDEIINKIDIINPELANDNDYVNCPYCKTGNLVLRGQGRNQFYGCSNYPYCEYNQKKNIVESSRRCPKCEHFIVWRNGRSGKFLGCSNYPRCRFTINPREYGFDEWKPVYENYNKIK